MPQKQFKQRPVDTYPKLQEKYDMLEKMLSAHLDLGLDMMKNYGDTIYDADQFMVTILNRSMNLVDGIIALTERWNAVSAMALLRLQIDNLMRMYYVATKQDERVEILKKWRNGERWDRIKISSGVRLNDRHMLEHAKATYDWIDDMYTRTCNHVHLSLTHFAQIVKSYDPGKDVAHMTMGIGSEHWSEKLIDEFLYDVGNVTDAILKIVKGWIMTKAKIAKR